MKKTLTLLVTIIGSVTLTCPLYAADKADRHNIKSDIDGDKIQKQDSSQQMDPDASNLKNEFRKLLLIYNPW
jgi:uncharacterized protein YxeA